MRMEGGGACEGAEAVSRMALAAVAVEPFPSSYPEYSGYAASHSLQCGVPEQPEYMDETEPTALGN